MHPGCLQSQLEVMLGKGKGPPFLLHGPSAPGCGRSTYLRPLCSRLWQVDIPAVSWSGCFQEAVLLSFSSLIYPFCSALPLPPPPPSRPFGSSESISCPCRRTDVDNRSPPHLLSV